MTAHPTSWRFEPHQGFGDTDPDGEPWPFGYISDERGPLFELSDVLGNRDPEELAKAAILATAAPDLLRALHGMIGLVQLIVPTLPKEHREAVEGNHRLADALAAIARAEAQP